MSLLRYIFIDEIEAAGVDVMQDSETAASVWTRREPRWRFFPSGDDEQPQVRPWGGVNVLLTGDFWQLTPVASIAFMSNPLSQQVRESGKAQSMMSMMWSIKNTQSRSENPALNNQVAALTQSHLLPALQAWDDQTYVFELSRNIRSGSDDWWNSVLEQCRQGALSEANYNWMHGYPTDEPINAECLECHGENMCHACETERQRRNRIKSDTERKQLLSTTFSSAIYIIKLANAFASDPWFSYDGQMSLLPTLWSVSY